MKKQPLPIAEHPHITQATLPLWTRQVVWMLVVVSLSLMAARIAVVRSSNGEVPFLSANDRSRWATVAGLIDYRTYAIDHFQNLRDPQTNRRTWQTIDRVQHRDENGEIHNYSSKPPLYPTLIAGVYAAVKSVTGMGLQDEPFVVGRIILAIVNLPQLAIFLLACCSLALRHCRHAWSAIFIATVTCFGTLLLPFASSLNNHLPAAASIAAAVWLLDRSATRGASWGKMFACGLVVGFALANELPALSILPPFGLIALRIAPRQTILGFVPGLALVAIGFFGTNWLAHHSLKPPYTHRGVGATIATFPTTTSAAATGAPWIVDPQDATLREQLAEPLQIPATEIQLSPSRTADRLRIDTENATFALDRLNDALVLRHWDDWYDYPGTYWNPATLKGVDSGEPSRLVYTLHALVGHHGLFLLSPVWCLSLAGVCCWWRRRPSELTLNALVSPSYRDTNASHPYFPGFAIVMMATTVLVTGVCFAFYISRPEIDRNYGGVSVAFRWLLWQIPLWLFLAMPAADCLASHPWGRRLCVVLLAVSCFSVATALETPWTHPWVYKLMDNLGWIKNG